MAANNNNKQTNIKTKSYYFLEKQKLVVSISSFPATKTTMITRRQIFISLWLLFAAEPVSANFFNDLWTKLLNFVHCPPGPLGKHCKSNSSNGGGSGGGDSDNNRFNEDGSDGQEAYDGGGNAANDYNDYNGQEAYDGGGNAANDYNDYNTGVSDGTNSLRNSTSGAVVNWLPYVIIGGVLAAFIFIAVWRKRRQLNNSDLKEDLNGDNKDIKGSVKERMERTTSGMPVSPIDDVASQTTFVSSASTGYVDAANLDDVEV